VDKDGLLTAVAPGRVTIEAQCNICGDLRGSVSNGVLNDPTGSINLVVFPKR
jgi:hypothetical protein